MTLFHLIKVGQPFLVHSRHTTTALSYMYVINSFMNIINDSLFHSPCFKPILMPLIFIILLYSLQNIQRILTVVVKNLNILLQECEICLKLAYTSSGPVVMCFVHVTHYEGIAVQSASTFSHPIHTNDTYVVCPNQCMRGECLNHLNRIAHQFNFFPDLTKLLIHEVCNVSVIYVEWNTFTLLQHICILMSLDRQSNCIYQMI